MFMPGENPLKAAKLNQSIGERVLRYGDTMQGPLLLSRHPVQAFECATKQYVDGYNQIGPAGPPGPMGPSGAPGGTGPQGNIGPAGPAGPQGPQGNAGANSTVPGPTGPQGPQGNVGTPGAAGAQGAQGPQGNNGAQGPAGPTGATGAASVVPGPQGPAGATGATGAASTVPGPPGATGATGAQGSVGPAGPANIIAGTTPTTAFTAGQLMLSDGALTQPWKHGVAIQVGDTTYPLNIIPHTIPDGIYGNFQFNSGGCSVYLFADQAVGAAGIEIPGGSNGGIYSQNSFFGFTTGTNSSTYAPDTAYTAIEYSTAGFRCLESPTTPSALRVYNTFTNFNNGEWGGIDWRTVPGTLTIGSQANGTGVQRAVNIVGASLSFNNQPIPAIATVSDTPPTISQGRLWFDSVSTRLYMGYNDGNSSQWVLIA